MSDSRLGVTIGSLELSSPLIPASGVYPMEGDSWSAAWMDACCTKGLTLHPREGNPGVRVRETPSGMLNSIGLENPGLDRWIAEILPVLAATRKKIIVNLSFDTLDDLALSLERLGEVRDCVSALELNLSCPNVESGGAAWGLDGDLLERAVSTARRLWRGDLWVKMTPQAADFTRVARRAEGAGADALVVANTWLGMAMNRDGTPLFSRRVAGLSGAAIFPLALRLAFETARAVRIPIIGCGGISSAQDVLDMVCAGASAVMVGTALFRNVNLLGEIEGQLPPLLDALSAARLCDVIGRAHEERRRK